MPAKKKSLTPEQQRAEFIATAKASGADESGKSFEKAFKKIINNNKDSRRRP